jgi:hypothetical protein
MDEHLRAQLAKIDSPLASAHNKEWNPICRESELIPSLPIAFRSPEVMRKIQHRVEQAVFKIAAVALAVGRLDGVAKPIPRGPGQGT